METLALDCGFQPLARISWQRAMTLLFQGKVEVVEEYEDKTIRAVTFEIRMPSVVRFLRALRRKKNAVKFSRENVYMRDKGRCQYCSTRVPRDESTYDHVIPRLKGGKTDWFNVVISCIPCNQKKGGRTPEEAGMRLLSQPVRPKKLPDAIRFSLVWNKNMPLSWKQWLTSMTYWHSELENDIKGE